VDIGVIDVFLIKPIDEKLLIKTLEKYDAVISLEEGFINNAGLDSLVMRMINSCKKPKKFKNMGFAQKYVFDIGSREYLHKLNDLGQDSIMKNIKTMTR
jgi:transketolase